MLDGRDGDAHRRHVTDLRRQLGRVFGAQRLGEPAGAVEIGVDDRDQPGGRHFRILPHMVPAHVTGADDGDRQRFAHAGCSLSGC